MKIPCFYDFLRKNPFLPIFYTQNGHFSIFVGALTLWLVLVRQIKLRIQALINILIFTELFILSLTPFCIQM